MKITLLKKFIRLKRWVKKFKGSKPDYLSKEHKKVIEIIRTLISNKENILLVDVLTMVRYIDGKKTLSEIQHVQGEIFVVIDQEKISIMNGVYYYDVYLPKNTAFKLNHEFDIEVSRRRRHLELIKRNNINSRLDDLAKQIQ